MKKAFGLTIFLGVIVLSGFNSLRNYHAGPLGRTPAIFSQTSSDQYIPMSLGQDDGDDDTSDDDATPSFSAILISNIHFSGDHNYAIRRPTRFSQQVPVYVLTRDLRI